jgi:hypothetical protein
MEGGCVLLCEIEGGEGVCEKVEGGEGGRDADKYVVWFGDQGRRQGTGKGLVIQGEYFGIVSYDIAQKETSPAKLQRKHPITQTLLPSTSDPTTHTISTMLLEKRNKRAINDAR